MALDKKKKKLSSKEEASEAKVEVKEVATPLTLNDLNRMQREGAAKRKAED